MLWIIAFHTTSRFDRIVNSKFENLSNTLEDIAVKRKQALDDPNFSPATIGIDRLTYAHTHGIRVKNLMPLFLHQQ